MIKLSVADLCRVAVCADRIYLDGFAKIPADAIHELACLVLEIYMGVTRR